MHSVLRGHVAEIVSETKSEGVLIESLACESFVQTRDQAIVTERFSQITARASRQQADTHSLLGKCGHEDDRYLVTIRDQALLQLDSAYARHLHVGNNASRVGDSPRIQIFYGRSKSRRCVAQ
jgi:hypothetical protein